SKQIDKSKPVVKPLRNQTARGSRTARKAFSESDITASGNGFFRCGLFRFLRGGKSAISMEASHITVAHIFAADAGGADFRHAYHASVPGYTRFPDE
ncbi:MAG: hypothetical protein WBM78_10225, partial [Desulfobacterales bacterium]